MICRPAPRQNQPQQPQLSLPQLVRQEDCAACEAKVFTGGIGTTDWRITDNWEKLINGTNPFDE